MKSCCRQQKKQNQWLENKQVKAKATSIVDPGKKERDELKVRIDKLSAELTKKEKGGFCSFKRKTPNNSPKASPRSQDTNRTNLKGPEITAAGPFREGRRPIQCYKCGGWGHVQRECVTQGNVNWEELNRVEPTPTVIDPVSESSKTQ